MPNMSIEKNAEMSSVRRHDGMRAAKKPYRAPRVDDYGSVAELTQTGSGTIEDGGGVFAFSGAAS